MQRVSTSTVPTSSIAATATRVDGFTTAQSDHLGGSWSFTRQYLSTGILSTTTNPLQWSSEVYDKELALTYYNYRHYNPADGRWINRDPIGIKGGLNLYGFVGNRAWLWGVLGEKLRERLWGQKQPCIGKYIPPTNGKNCKCCEQYVKAEKAKHLNKINKILANGCSITVACVDIPQPKNKKHTIQGQCSENRNDCKDSTIEIACNTSLSKNTFAHELQHADDICNGFLKYDGNCLYTVCSEIRAYSFAELSRMSRTDINFKSELKDKVRRSVLHVCNNSEKDRENFKNNFDNKFNEEFKRCLP